MHHQQIFIFRRPQADFVRGRDYSFAAAGSTEMLSLNTLAGRVRVAFDVPENFHGYFDGSWSFGGGKLVCLNGEWYFHISMTRAAEKEFSLSAVKHVAGIDRGLRFLATVYDEKGKTAFLTARQSWKSVPLSRRHAPSSSLKEQNQQNAH